MQKKYPCNWKGYFEYAYSKYNNNVISDMGFVSHHYYCMTFVNKYMGLQAKINTYAVKHLIKVIFFAF